MIPHSHLLDTLQSHHIPLPITRWVHSFLQDQKATLCLDGKRDDLHLIKTGVPQGLCILPILAAYFTSPMIDKVHQEATTRIEDSTELSPIIRENKHKLTPTSLYVDDGAILTTGHTLQITAQIITIAFEETHKWLAHRGLKTDQVKNELMHYTKTKNRQASPSIHIPTNNHTVLKEVTPTNCMRYLSLWFNPQLRFHEHAKIVTSKASRATEALRMLGNSISRMNQLCLRQTYLGTVLPIVTYGSIAFWDGKSSTVKNTLECMQNKALCFITGAFKTTPIHALEIESSIPPINITLDYYTECYATHTQRLDHSKPLIFHIPYPPIQTHPIPTTPPLPSPPPP